MHTTLDFWLNQEACAVAACNRIISRKLGQSTQHNAGLSNAATIKCFLFSLAVKAGTQAYRGSRSQPCSALDVAGGKCTTLVSSLVQDLTIFLKKQALSCWTLLFLLFILNEWRKCQGSVFLCPLYSHCSKLHLIDLSFWLQLLCSCHPGKHLLRCTGWSVRLLPLGPLSKKQIMSYILCVFSSTGLQMCHGPISIPSRPSQREHAAASPGISWL